MHALLPQECDYEKYTEGRYLDICGRGRKWFKCNKQAISVCACVCVCVCAYIYIVYDVY